MISGLMRIWRDSVSATHTFLTPADIDMIAAYVPDALRSIPVLLVAEDQGVITGFAGIDKEQLEMLFISPDFRNQGIGKAMVQSMFRDFSVTEVCVKDVYKRQAMYWLRLCADCCSTWYLTPWWDIFTSC